MLEPAGERQCSAPRLACPCWLSNRPIELRSHRQPADGRIVSEVGISVMGVAFFVVNRHPTIDVRDGARQRAPHIVHHPGCVMGLKKYTGAVKFAGDTE